MLGIRLANAAVDAVRTHDDITITEARKIFDRALIMDCNTDLLAALLQDVEERQPRAAGKAVAAAADLPALVTDDDVVPIGERIPDHRVGFGVAAQELLEHLVREHHSESERVVGPVLFVNVDFP